MGKGFLMFLIFSWEVFSFCCEDMTSLGIAIKIAITMKTIAIKLVIIGIVILVFVLYGILTNIRSNVSKR